jgi:CubicO group peptidase (beta-lactamase class C family)
MKTVAGFTSPGFERLADLLATGTTIEAGGKQRRVDLGEGGGAFCAFAEGDTVVDLWAGIAEPGVEWTRDTKAVVMSSTKGMTALCAHVLFDRGELDVDAAVEKYWPEFAAAGKERTSVRHLLSHQSGAIGVPGAHDLLSWSGGGWGDTEAIAAAIAGGPPAWEPGTRHGYHALTFGWLVGELVRRVTDTSLGEFFRSEVAAKLGADCRIGTPPEELGGVASVIEWGDSSAPRRQPGPMDPESFAGRSVLAGAHGSLFFDETGSPRFAEFMNNPQVLGSEIGAIGGTSTARGLARLYSSLACGEELVSRRSVEVFSAEQVCGKDAVMRTPSRWALGYTRESPPLGPGLPRQHGPNDEAFGHMGAGGQVAFADPVWRVGCAFVRNHMENQAFPLMGACLVQALYESLAETRR